MQEFGRAVSIGNNMLILPRQARSNEDLASNVLAFNRSAGIH